MAIFLISRYRNELEIFSKYFDKSLIKQSPENVHELRVSIKKIRALNNIIWPYLKKPTDVKYLNLFDDLFKQAGRVREAQVNHMLILEQYENYLKSYLEHQKEIVAKDQKALKYQLGSFNLAHIKKLEHVVTTSLSTISERSQVQTAINHLSISLHQINRLLKSDQNNKSLHSIRKNVRQANEILKLIDSSISLKKMGSILREIQDRIGNWHDQVVLARFVKDLIERQPSGIELDRFKALLEQLDTKASNTRDAIFKSFEKDFPGLMKLLKRSE